MIAKRYSFYTTYYFTLNDLFDKFSTSQSSQSLPGYQAAWDKILVDPKFTCALDELRDTSVLDTFVKKYLLPLGAQLYVFSSDLNEIESRDAEQWFYRFAEWINETANRYTYLINTYKDNEAKLLDAVKSKTTTTTKGVDAPQDNVINDIDEAESGNYISTLGNSEMETSSDVTTLMGRLDEIRKGYRNLYAQWLTDFKRKFNFIVEA